MSRAASREVRRFRSALAPLLAAIAHPLSRLAPRSSQRWVFGHAGDRFTGNPKYLFLWMAIHRPDLHVTWLTSDDAVRRRLVAAGYRAQLRWSPGGVLAAMRARVFVFAHGLGNVNAPLSGGAYLLNLWHGVGLKAIHLGHAGGKTADAARRATSGWLGRLGGLEYLRPYDTVATTSDLMQAHFASQMQLPAARCPQLGYPRMDCAADPALAAVVERMDAALGFRWPDGVDEVYIYVPTFRDTGRPFLAEALPDLDRLSAVLAKRRALLFVKPHPDTPDRLPGHHRNIVAWPDEIDLNPYLPRFTGLITDYSSVLYDYLFGRDVGAILYTYDYADYVARDRALLYPFDDNVAGVRVDRFDALLDVLASGAALQPRADTARIRDRFWGGSPRPSSPAVVAHVLRRVDDATS